MSTRLLTVTFHEIAIKWVTVKNSVDFIRYFYELYRGIAEVPSLQILSNDLSSWYIHHVMKDFHLCIWLLSYDLSKIPAKLVISLKHNIIFAKFLEILLDNVVTSSLTHIRWQSKNHLEVIWVYIFQFFIKGTVSPKCF